MSRARRRWAACAPAVVALLWSWACATRLPVLAPRAAPAAVSVASIRAEEDQVVSLRARFSATTTYGGEERSADGVLLVEKPDRFRLRLYLPLGLTVFDYLTRGDRTWVTMPLRRDGGAVPPDDLAVFTREDLGQAFLRGDSAFPGVCDASPVSDEVVITCRAASQIQREIRVARATGTIIEETSYAQGAPRMILRYSDYRPVRTQELPFHVSLLYPANGMAVDITIRQYELNPHLTDALFQPPEER